MNQSRACVEGPAPSVPVRRDEQACPAVSPARGLGFVPEGNTVAAALSPGPDSDIAVTTIAPRRGWRAIDLTELWRAREMFLFLVWRDVKVRYKQTVIGAAWAILQPLTSMIIFSLIFGRVAGIPSDGVPYPLFVFAGILPWTFFSTAVSQAGVSLVNQAQLVTKVYFPRLLVPASSIGVGLVDFGLGLVVYVGIMCWYAHLPALTVLLLPLLLLLMVVAGLGVGYLLASVTVIYRDFRLAIPFMIQAWMFLSPVVYPVSFLPESYRWALALNPMTGIIEAFRSVLLNRPLDLGLLGVAALVSLTVFVVGVYRFRLAERRFADIV